VEKPELVKQKIRFLVYFDKKDKITFYYTAQGGARAKPARAPPNGTLVRMVTDIMIVLLKLVCFYI